MLNENQIKFSTVNSHIAHTCGNIAAIIKQQFESKFPKDYFKHVHKSTYIALRQFRNIKDELDLKWSKPYLTIQPKLISEKTDGNVDMWRRLYDTNIYDLLQPDYHNVKFFRDPDKGLIIDFSVERMKMGFDFNVVVSSEYQQYNILGHMNTIFNIDNPYHNPVILETIVPDCIIKQLSESSGVPIHDENGSVKPFLNYINRYSKIPITLKYNPATGKNLFHMMIRSSIFQVYSQLDIGTGNQINMTTESFPIDIQLMCEFNYPASFFFVSTKEAENSLPRNVINSDDMGDGTYNLYYTMQQTIIPHYDKDDKRMTISVAFDVEDTETGEDIIDISQLITGDEGELLDAELKEINYITGDYIKSYAIYIYENENLMSNKDYYMDWKERKLVLTKYKTTNTYRLALYVDYQMVNKYVELKNNR